MLTKDDIAIIATMWLVLCNMGYDVQDLDLNSPGYIRREGPQTIYTFAILLRDDEVFQKDKFCELIDAYSSIGRFKVHYYDIEEYEGHSACVCCSDEMDAFAANALTILRNFTTIYVSIYA